MPISHLIGSVKLIVDGGVDSPNKSRDIESSEDSDQEDEDQDSEESDSQLAKKIDNHIVDTLVKNTEHESLKSKGTQNFDNAAQSFKGDNRAGSYKLQSGVANSKMLEKI